MNPLLKRLLFNTSWLLSDKAGVMFSRLITAFVLARALSPSGYGSLNYVLAVVALVVPFSELGLNAVVTRELVNTPDQETRIMTTSTLTRLVGAGLGTTVCLLIALMGWRLDGGQERLALGILAIANLMTAFQVIEFWFQARIDAKTVARMRVSVALFFCLVKVLAAWAGVPMWGLAALFAGETALTGLGFLYFYQRGQGRFSLRSFDRHYALSLLKQGLWLILSGLASIVYLKIDQVMLAQMSGRHVVGIYAVAARLSEAWYVFPVAIVTSLFPPLLQQRKESLQGYWQRLQQVSDLLFIFALGLSLGTMVVATVLIRLLFGEAYVDAALILRIHIWASLFIYMRALVSKWLIAEHLLPYSLLSHGLGAVINLVANLVMIPLWGGVGAAIATLVSYFVASYAAFWVLPAGRPMAQVMTRSLCLPFTLGYRYWPQMRARWNKVKQISQ
jgi:PST family polysaccharide transporter